MIPAMQPPVHPCADVVPGDEVVCSLVVVGDVVGCGVGAIVVAIRMKSPQVLTPQWRCQTELYGNEATVLYSTDY